MSSIGDTYIQTPIQHSSSTLFSNHLLLLTVVNNDVVTPETILKLSSWVICFTVPLRCLHSRDDGNELFLTTHAHIHMCYIYDLVLFAMKHCSFEALVKPMLWDIADKHCHPLPYQPISVACLLLHILPWRKIKGNEILL